jgi:peptide-methionine (S)-S-oxide reductase
MDIMDIRRKHALPSAEEALPGREFEMPVTHNHTVLGTPLMGPFSDHLETAQFGLGCFWGAERVFWKVPGVYTTAVGYAAGYTPNPTYQEVCTGQTGHNEVVLVVFNPTLVSYADLLRVFWESHDPTQGMRQGNDWGTQYRSGIYTNSDAQAEAAQVSRDEYDQRLKAAGYSGITTEIQAATEFYYAEEYHQQYLDKNPAGYCGIGGTGVACGIGRGVTA